MGRVDPINVSVIDVVGGVPTTTTVDFDGVMTPGAEDPVSYTGDIEALMPGAPIACPSPPSQQNVGVTSFIVNTKKVSSTKSVTIFVHGPHETKQATFKIHPEPQ